MHAGGIAHVLKRWLWLVLALCIVLATGLGFFWPFRNQAILRLSGTVEIQEVRLASKVGGRVGEVLVQEGQIVSPGARLVVFEAPELEALRDQLKARLQQAEADYAKVANGPRLEEKLAGRAVADAAKARLDRLVAGWREEEKRTVASELETARADLKQAEAEFERISTLYQQKSVSQADVDAATGGRDRARGKLRAVQSRYEMMLSGSRKEDIAEARADYDKARAQADLLDAGSRWEDVLLASARVREARANLDEVEVKLREAVVLAPEGVVVDVVAVRKGDVVPPNQPVLRVLRADDLWVKVYVPEPKLEMVRMQQEVDVFTDAFPNRPLTGRVIFIDPISEFTPRNVQSSDERRHQVFGVKIHVDNPRGLLKAGMAAEVRIPLLTSP
jgi:multidrug resistance efflux pump